MTSTFSSSNFEKSQIISSSILRLFIMVLVFLFGSNFNPFQSIASSLQANQSEKLLLDIPENPFALDKQLSCGPRCAQFLLSLYQQNVDYANVIRECTPGPKGTSLKQVQEVLENHKLYVVPIAGATVDKLKRVHYPVIVHVNSKDANNSIGHFLVLTGWNDKSNSFRAFDPPGSYGEIPVDKIAGNLSGLGLVVSNEVLPPAEELIDAEFSLSYLVIVTSLSFFCLLVSIANFWCNYSRNDSLSSADSHASQSLVGLDPKSVLLLGGLLLFPGCSDTKSERLEKTPRTVDVGEHISGPPITYTFKIPNESQKPFQITNIQKSCSCQAADYDSEKIINPGENAELTVELPTKGSEGPVNFNFTMETNSEDESYRSIPLFLTAKLKPKIKALPSRLSFGSLKAGEEAKSKLIISSLEVDPEKKLLSFEILQQLPYIQIVQLPDNSLGTVSFEVQVLNDAPIGDLNSMIVLKFEDHEVPEIKIPVSGRIKGPIHTTPRVVVVNAGDSPPSIVRLSSKQGEPFKVTRVSAEASIQASEIVKSTNNEVRYQLNIPENIPAGHYLVSFTLNHPRQKTISLPVIVQN